ncbi:hypothetical protein BIY37_06075 [Candidatus Brocadia sapporoensis]|uniref:Uncharacterized protein n=1 Tax=Candidatus Brocadia sapporoensis TaxID=392547 RepID=A0A1V6M0I0_9BACT|nr:hypothetical protein BIY37_06075 [Candidatus Brocadia sapporoensis]
MSGFRRISLRPLRISLAIGLIMATEIEVRAEPNISGSHRPILWLIVLTGGFLSAMILHFIGKWTKLRYPQWMSWLASVLFFLLFMLFFAPLNVAFGNILFTGRTM